MDYTIGNENAPGDPFGRIVLHKDTLEPSVSDARAL